MSRGRQKVRFEGLMQENVLGTFRIIRGFADLRDLTEVSVAMPYQGTKDGQGTGYPNSQLSPKRADEQTGASYEIPAWIFSEIDQSRLVIADLTDERPNVYCEVGYAKSRGIPFILTFHKRRADDEPPWNRESSPGNKVHFDLIPYRYIQYDSAIDLRTRLTAELEGFLVRSLSDE